jgi:glutamate-5-semialdehyde dehydrogenase
MTLAGKAKTAVDSNSAQAIEAQMAKIGTAARSAASELAHATTDVKNASLESMARELMASTASILTANEKDISLARRNDQTEAFIDRLKLDADRIKAMATGLMDIAALPDPVGDIISQWDRPNGLNIARTRVPLGVIGIIYESRPNVTADAGALCMKSGNAVILRGGSDSFGSSRAIVECLQNGLAQAGLPGTAIQMVPTTNRIAVGMMLAGLNGTIDLIVPRGGKSLVKRVQDEARVPVFSHLEGICHVYVDKAADLEMARKIVLNAKMRRVGVCGAAETLLVDRACAQTNIPGLVEILHEAGCEIRGDEEAQKISALVKPASHKDWSTEYLDNIIALKTVDGVDGAIEHIEHYGSRHTDSIVTQDGAAADKFLAGVDSAIVLHNASTQYADGGEFGMGAEIGIATGKMHARGPVGLEQLTSFKYVVRGTGQTRP